MHSMPGGGRADQSFPFAGRGLFTNKITGSLPTEIGNLGSLQKLYPPRPPERSCGGCLRQMIEAVFPFCCRYLHHNDITGPLSTEIGDLANRRELYALHVPIFSASASAWTMSLICGLEQAPCKGVGMQRMLEADN